MRRARACTFALILVLLFSGFGIASSLVAQEPAALAPGSKACELSQQPPLSVKRANIFTPQQEEWLGQAQAAEIEPEYLLLPPERTEFLEALAGKISAQLPPAPYHYVVHVFESGQIRSFSLAGGQIYVSRKLVLDARSEDELAGMLAHEIALIYTHHTATAFTLELKNLLDVKQVGDETDVNDKLQRLLNVPRVFLDTKWKPNLSFQDQQDDELLADRVGFYAYVKSGYAPAEYATMLDRISVNVGYRGNLLTDLLEQTPVVSMRVNLAKKLANELPGACRAKLPSRNAVFLDFQAKMNRARVDPLTAETPGLKYDGARPADEPGTRECAGEPGWAIRSGAGWMEDSRLRAEPVAASVLDRRAGRTDGAVHAGLAGRGVLLRGVAL